MWVALATLAASVISSQSSGGGSSGGGGGGGAMGGGANAWSPTVGLANALFGGKGKSESASDYGHAIADSSGDRYNDGRIFFSSSWEWPKALTFAVIALAIALIWRRK